jgi:hypothetical protein
MIKMKKILLLLAVIASGNAFAECADARGDCYNAAGQKIGSFAVNQKANGTPWNCEIMKTGGGNSLDVAERKCRDIGGVKLNANGGITFLQGVTGAFQEAPKVIQQASDMAGQLAPLAEVL